MSKPSVTLLLWSKEWSLAGVHLPCEAVWAPRCSKFGMNWNSCLEHFAPLTKANLGSLVLLHTHTHTRSHIQGEDRRLVLNTLGVVAYFYMSLDSTHALSPWKLWHHAHMTSPADKEEDFFLLFLSQLHWNVNIPCWSVGRLWSIGGRGPNPTALLWTDECADFIFPPLVSPGWREATATDVQLRNGILNVRYGFWTLAAGRHQTERVSSQNDFWKISQSHPDPRIQKTPRFLLHQVVKFAFNN